MKGLLVPALLFVIAPALAGSGPGYSGVGGPAAYALEADGRPDAQLYPTTYALEIDGHSFEVPYRVDADVIAMAVDQELDSLLIGLENAGDSVMVIDLAHKLIRAENGGGGDGDGDDGDGGGAYAVLVNGIEVDYGIVTDGDSSALSFFVPEFSEEVEIIGTYVIPEFPPVALAGTAALVLAAVLAASRAGWPLFRW